MFLYFWPTKMINNLYVKVLIQTNVILYLQEWVRYLDLYSLTQGFILYRLFNVPFNLVKLALI